MNESNGLVLSKEIDWETYELINNNSLANSIIIALSETNESGSKTNKKRTREELISKIYKSNKIKKSDKLSEKFDYLLNDLVGRKIINVDYQYDNGHSKVYYELTAKNFVTKELLLKYWDTIPVVKHIPSKLYNNIDEHPIRNAILLILREGVEENDYKRHALSLKELLPLVNKFIKEKYDKNRPSIKMTAIYYHRDKLIEDELLKEVATFLEGKRYVTYYGRTAKAYIVREGFENEKEKYLSDLKKVLYAISGENESAINDVLNNFEESNQKITNQFDQWIEGNVNIINKLDIDVISLYELIGQLYFTHPAHKGLPEKMYKLLKLPQYEKLS